MKAGDERGGKKIKLKIKPVLKTLKSLVKKVVWFDRLDNKVVKWIVNIVRDVKNRCFGGQITKFKRWWWW